ncbi:MAG TPA: hypothetical protein VFZ98_01750, partial [Vicinamibacterales bacterium]
MQRADTSAAAPVDVVQYNVTRKYFEVAGIRFLRGATWRSDLVDAPSAVVLDEQAVQRLFG